MPHAIDYVSQAHKDIDDAYAKAPRQVREYAETLYDVLSTASPAGQHLSKFDANHVSETATCFPLDNNAEVYLSYQKDSMLATRLQSGHTTLHNVKIAWREDSIDMQYYDREDQKIIRQSLCSEHAHRPSCVADQMAFAERIKTALALV